MPGANSELSRLIVDPAAYAEWTELQAAFARARRDVPVARIEADGFDPFWAVTKAEDIREVERQAAVFAQNGLRAGLYSQKGYVTAQTRPPNSSMVAMDAPEHAKLRGVTAGWFMSGRVKRLEAGLRPLAKAAVNRLLESGGTCEFSEDVAVRYPLQVILSILGIPREETETVLRLSQRVFGTGPDAVGLRDSPTSGDAAEDFRQYFRALAEDRRRSPRDDLATLIATAVIDGEEVGDKVATAYYITLSTAGHDTTSAALAGAIWGLSQSPEQFRALKARPELVSKVPDEAVRWTTPVQTFMRTARRPYRLRGQDIAAGDWLMLCYPSGNRDEESFPDPHAFRLDRTSPHVGFGFGPHMCLGMHLAKLEIQLFLEELLPHIRSLELNGTPRRAASYFVGGANHVPIRFEREVIGAP
jgi:hypothetical protein